MRLFLFSLLLPITISAQDTSHADPIVIEAEKDIPIPKHRKIAGRELQNEDQLLFSQVVWRHGDRAPVGTYPNDIHQEDAWPNGWGELTPLGMRQQFALGRLLYKKYINSSHPLLSKSYNSKEVYIRSTDVNRTLISAMSNIAGMFENGVIGVDYPASSRWPRGWTPIPVHTVAEKDDPIGNVFAPCARAEQLLREIYNGSGFRDFVKENQEFLEFVAKKSGASVDMQSIYTINDVHYIEKLYNMSQPDWITDEVEMRLRNLSQVSARYMFGIGDPYVPELIRLRGGPLLRAMIDKMRLKIDCHVQNNIGKKCEWISRLKYHAYSAHDTTVYAFLTTLGDEERVIEGGMPHYTASVDVELWDLTEIGPAVRILFHSAFHHNYHVITHLTKGCPRDSEFCPLQVFEKRSLKFMPVDYEKECRVGESEKSKIRNRTSWKLNY